MTARLVDLTALRRRAESKLASAKMASRQSFDPVALVHELQVHEIELELQNEALMVANDALERVRARYQALYDDAPVGCLTLSAAGAIEEANLRAAEMFGRDRASLPGLRARDFLDAGSVKAFDDFLRAAIGSVARVAADGLMLQRRGAPVYVRAQGESTTLAPNAAPVVLVALMDVTTLRYAFADVLGSIQK
ncbi:MAG TPA: PAS domain-containing protein [Burkholderiaceae bacterium]|jgi:PAS domain-containing protein